MMSCHITIEWIFVSLLEVYNLLLERMCYPIITTNGSYPHVIHIKQFPHKSGEVSEFLYIKHLLDDPELSKTFGYQGHEHVTKNYDWNRIVSMYEALYQKYG